MIAVAVGLKQIVLWAVTTFIRFLQELGSLKSELGSLDLAGRLVQDPSPPAGKGPQGPKYLGRCRALIIMIFALLVPFESAPLKAGRCQPSYYARSDAAERQRTDTEAPPEDEDLSDLSLRGTLNGTGLGRGRRGAGKRLKGLDTALSSPSEPCDEAPAQKPTTKKPCSTTK